MVAEHNEDLGALPLKVPQTRDCEFYPPSLEKGLRSARSGAIIEDVRRLLNPVCTL